MSNENGFPYPTWSVSQLHTAVSEGSVIGIAFGWMIVCIGFYVLGLFIICKCVKNTSEDEQEPSQQQSSDKDKDRVKEDPSSKRKTSEQPSDIIKPKRKRKVIEQNPTLQLVQFREEQPQSKITKQFKKVKQ